MTDPDFLDEFFVAARETELVRFQLQDMAFASSRLGMHELSDELFHIAKAVEVGCAAMRSAYSGHINHQLQESQRAVGETLLTIVRAAGSKATGGQP